MIGTINIILIGLITIYAWYKFYIFMNKINTSKLWKIIQEARDYMGEESILLQKKENDYF